MRPVLFCVSNRVYASSEDVVLSLLDAVSESEVLLDPVDALVDDEPFVDPLEEEP